MVNFEIDITDTLAKFSDFFENSKRMILSAKFGDGKTYLLDKFMRQDNLKNPKYYFVVLHPVNYVVEDNRDIFEYIKRDILFQLLQDDMLLDTEESLDRLVEAISENISISEVFDFLSAIAPIPGFKSVAELLGKCTVKVSEIRKTYQNKKMLPYNYVNSFALKTGSIAECDGFTRLIQETLRIIEEMHQCQTVLVIEDIDRLDPAHLFRILNILGANIDNPYFESTTVNINCDQERNPNKFGFTKILLVMDYGTSEHIFHHFYGDEADYKGYMQKFLDSHPFKFSLRSEAQQMLIDEIKKICLLDDSFFDTHLLYSKRNGKGLKFKEYISMLSVRRCKQILTTDIDKYLRIDEDSSKYIRTLRIIIYLMLLTPEDVTINQIYKLFTENVALNIDFMFPVLKTFEHSTVNCYSITYGNQLVSYNYDEQTQKSSSSHVNHYNNQLIEQELQQIWKSAEHEVLLHIDFA